MTRFRRSANGIGLALAVDEVIASLPGADSHTRGIWTRALDPFSSSAGAWPDLVAALRELRETLPAGAREVAIALLPSLVQVRCLTLPKLRGDELRRILERDATRYFLARDEQVVAAELIGSTRRSPRPLVAAAASARLLDVIHEAAREAEWTVTSIVPAHSAWLEGCSIASPSSSGDRRLLLCAERGRADAVATERGQIVAIRRATYDPSEPSAIRLLLNDDDDAKPCGGQIAVVVSADERDRIAAIVSGCDAVVSDQGDAAVSPSVLAAEGAMYTRRLALVPARMRERERRRAKRTALSIGAVAAVLMILAAGLELWGAKRELRAVESERAALREQTRAALDARDAIVALESRLATLAALERSAPRWSSVIAAVADHLPPDAHLLALRGRGDTVLLEGVARNASGVFEALRVAPGVTGVRADAPVRQESREGAEPVERFALAAQLASRRAPGETP